jgi:carboxypeptidase C (cathepsin A)
MRLSSLALAGLMSLALAAPQGAFAAPPAKPAEETGAEAAKPHKAEADSAQASAVEQKRVTHHAITVNGKTIDYEATAGTLTLRDDEGKPIGSMFYTAYTAKGPNRPVVFFYNGGPGSASLWLHMGSFGPYRVKVTSPEAIAPAPYNFGVNDQTLLDKADLVFIDAMGAGYSRPVGEAKAERFYGVDGDADAFARTVMRYLDLNNRWNSPKFLFGESYGTLRSGALAYQLEERGVGLNGVFLLSSILNYNDRAPGLDHVFMTYVPSYAATAWYHDKVPNKPADLQAFLAEARAWAQGPYLSAMAKGADLSPAEADQIAKKLSYYTGVSETYLREADLRLDLSRFRKELRRSERRVIGRYDSRFEGIDSDAAGEAPQTDPSSTSITPAFISMLHGYLAGELDYKTDMPYRPSAPDANRNWDWHHKPPGSNFAQNVPDTALDLAAAMRQNPHLHVFSLNGWYDMATPFFGTEYDLKHMPIDASLRGNVHFAYYPSGHMVYLNPEALKKLRADVGRFIDLALEK